uniref:Core-2/I-Branching enzyme n=1 Tax=Angiostrongylus cantonensis TaxID=6313 RepID=A0A0K0DC91_ANGCA
MLESIERYWPKQRVIVYDLGDVDRGKLEKWNFLEFRQFNFTRYPQYVRNLDEFRWKPIIIAEMLKEFSSIWYMDSSIVFKKGDLSHVYELIKCRKYVTHRPPVKPIFVRDLREALTEHESGWDVHQWNQNVDECRKMKIYKFIPTNFAEIKKPKAKMYDAGFVFAARTRDTIEKIVKWYVLCALEEDCMAGNHREWTYCRFLGDRFSEPPKCHRFDQSVVNLLAANAFYYDRHYYVSEIVDFFNIERQQ